MTSGFNLTPSELDQGGSQLENLSSRVEQHGSNVDSTHQRLSSSTGKGKSIITQTLNKLVTKTGPVFTGMFKEATRVTKEAGSRLKISGKRTKQTESDVKDSLSNIKNKGDNGHDRPQATTPGPSHSGGHTETSSSPAPKTPGETKPKSETPQQEHGSTEPSSAPPATSHGDTKPKDETPEKHGGDEPPVDKQPEPAPPKKKLAPAQDRLDDWKNNVDQDSQDVMHVKKPGPAQTAFGDTQHDRMFQIDQKSHDYKANEHASEGEPEKGGNFQTVFGKNGDKTSAVVMETYRSRQETYTGSDAFLHQYGAAHQGLNHPGGNNPQLKAVNNHLGSDASYADRLPDSPPNTIYHQNISGKQGKSELDNILGGQSHADLTPDQLNHVLNQTDNGKSVRNIVSTFNDVKGLSGDGAFRVTGGAVAKDSNGNHHLKFDVGQ